jgi:hypothetical protein
VDVNLMTITPPDSVLQEAVTVYQAAFGQPPYGETHKTAAGPGARLDRSAQYSVAGPEAGWQAHAP